MTGRCLCRNGWHGDTCQYGKNMDNCYSILNTKYILQKLNIFSECLRNVGPRDDNECKRLDGKCVCKYGEYSDGCVSGKW